MIGVERAWGLLDEAEHLAGNDAEGTRNIIDEAIVEGAASSQVLTRAARLLSADESGAEAAHALLERAVCLDGAPAPTQLALARSFAQCGNLSAASRWMQGAMLRARPDGALLLELATIEHQAALLIATAARSFPCRDASLAVSTGCTLLAQGHRKAARIAFDIAFAAGARFADYLTTYSELLADPAMHEDPPLPPGPLGMPHWWNVASMAAEARLAAAVPAETLVPTVASREKSDHWIGRGELGAFLAERIRAAEPFSWIRLNDGEARFLLHLHPDLGASVPEREASAMARLIWYVWFGQDLNDVPKASVEALGRQFETAIANADLLGLPSAEQLTGDKVHYGFCSGLERYMTRLFARSGPKITTWAGFNLTLNEIDPFLSSLLNGLDFVGVISPHPDLAGRLQRLHGIDHIRSYDIPGETRLDRPREHSDRGTHFPAIFGRIMRELEVPRRGAPFLVAGGLLGKIYCDRIRQLGGIAIDIGALADAWMGYNSRGRVLDSAMRWQLPA